MPHAAFHLEDLRAIVFDILGPILLLVILGAALRRKFALDMGTLGKLNLYLFVPAFMFDQVAHSTLSWVDMAGIVGITALQVAVLGIVVVGIGWIFHVNRKTLAAIALAVMFYNSGNYGLPLAKLAFPSNGAPTTVTSLTDGKNSAATGAATANNASKDSPRDGGATQTFVALTQNLLTFTVGMWITSLAGGRNGLSSITQVFRLPQIPMILLALLARWWLHADPRHHLPILIDTTAHYLSEGLVPVALVTLGAQLAVSPRWPRWRPVSAVLLLRLVLSPVLMLGLMFIPHMFGWHAADLWPWPAQLMILTAGTPSAINTLILTLELGGDAELTADCVFWTTVLSSFTITVWLIVVKMGMGS